MRARVCAREAGGGYSNMLESDSFARDCPHPLPLPTSPNLFQFDAMSMIDHPNVVKVHGVRSIRSVAVWLLCECVGVWVCG